MGNGYREQAARPIGVVSGWRSKRAVKEPMIRTFCVLSLKHAVDTFWDALELGVRHYRSKSSRASWMPWGEVPSRISRMSWASAFGRPCVLS